MAGSGPPGSNGMPGVVPAVVQALAKLQSHEDADRASGEQQLNQMREADYKRLFPMVSTIVADERQVPDARIAGSIWLKNVLDQKTDAAQAAVDDKWMAIAAPVRDAMKKQLIGTLLNTNPQLRRLVALTISAVGSIEIPRDEWKDLLKGLVSKVSDEKSDSLTKQECLNCLGYTCEKLDQRAMDQEMIDGILKCVIQTLQNKANDQATVYTAMKTLNTMLEFVEENFTDARKMQRDAIVGTVCDVTEHENDDVKIEAFECIANMGAMYYANMTSYIVRIFTITDKAVADSLADKVDERVGRLALEFWAQVMNTEAKIRAEEVDEESRGVTERGVPKLLPLFFKCLSARDKDEEVRAQAGENMDSTLAIMGGACMRHLCLALGPQCVKSVMPVAEKHFNSPDWRLRDAAILCLGNVFEANLAEPAALADKIQAAFTALMHKLLKGERREQDPRVRNTTAWSVAFVLQGYLPMIKPAQFEPTVNCLLDCLADPSPDVAQFSSYAFTCLAKASSDLTEKNRLPENPFDKFIPQALQRLFTAYNRADGHPSHLKHDAHLAMEAVVKKTPEKHTSTLETMLDNVLKNVETVGGRVAASQQEKGNKDEVLAQLLQLTSCLFERMGPAASRFAARAITDASRAYTTGLPQTIEDSFVVMQAALPQLPEDKQGQALESIWTCLGEVLNQKQTNPVLFQRAVVSVTFVSELLSHVSPDKLAILLRSLIAGLRNPEVTLENKSQVLSSIADVLIYMGTAPPVAAVDNVFQALAECHTIAIDEEDEDEVSELDAVFEAVAYTYTTIAQIAADEGGEKYHELIGRNMKPVSDFFARIALQQKNREAPNRSGELLKNIAGAIGDFAMTFGLARVSNFFRLPLDWVRFVLDNADAYEKEDWPRDSSNRPIPPMVEGTPKETAADFARRMLH